MTVRPSDTSTTARQIGSALPWITAVLVCVVMTAPVDCRRPAIGRGAKLVPVVNGDELPGARTILGAGSHNTYRIQAATDDRAKPDRHRNVDAGILARQADGGGVLAQ